LAQGDFPGDGTNDGQLVGLSSPREHVAHPRCNDIRLGQKPAPTITEGRSYRVEIACHAILRIQDFTVLIRAEWSQLDNQLSREMQAAVNIALMESMSPNDDSESKKSDWNYAKR
jgi:hypothetical protein